MSALVHMVSQDELPNLNFEFEDQDISTYVSIKLRIRAPNGIKHEYDAVIDDGPNGLFHFEIGTNDLGEGLHKMEVVFEPVADKQETWPADEPIQLDIRGTV